MSERNRQSIAVVLTLVGIQDAAIDVHQPGTDSAAISVRLGSALIYLHEPETVAKIGNAWFDMAGDARKLVREVSPALVAPVPGMRGPGVVLHASGSPPCSAILIQRPGQLSYLRVQVGRIVFNVRDLGAYTSTVGALRRAVALAPVAFPRGADALGRRKALEDAARAFPTVRARRRVAPRRRTATAASRPPAVHSSPRAEPGDLR